MSIDTNTTSTSNGGLGSSGDSTPDFQKLLSDLQNANAAMKAARAAADEAQSEVTAAQMDASTKVSAEHEAQADLDAAIQALITGAKSLDPNFAG